MIIEAKGARAAPSEGDPAKRYALTEERRGPGAILTLTALLAGMALWLKSVLPGWAAGPAIAPPSDGEAAARPAPPLRLVHSRTGDEAPPAESAEIPDAQSFAVRLALDPIGQQMPTPLTVSVAAAIDRYVPPETPLAWQGLAAEPNLAPPPTGGAGTGTPASGGAEIISIRRGDPPDPGGGDPGTPDVGSPPEEPAPDPGVETAGPPPGGTDGGDGGNSVTPTPTVQTPGTAPEDTGPGGTEPGPLPGKGEPANRAPRTTGPVYLADVGLCSVLAIGLADLLRNTVAPDGDPLSVTSISASLGSVVQSGDGWTYRPDPQTLGPVTLTYAISDGEFAVEQLASFSVVGRLFFGGTALDDALTGSACADDMHGGAGDDRIDGLGGDDVIAGGAGNDLIRGGDGDDVIRGGTGDDVIHGGDGRDQIWGGHGNDEIYGEGGDDIIFGEAGNDEIDGGEGDDVVDGGPGGDVIHGNAGHDMLDGGEGDDLIRGGEGDDVASGGAGRDQIWGGAGDDRVTGEAADDVIFGEAGDDLLSGGEGDDVIAGGPGDDLIQGDAGHDVLDGGAGDDRIRGGEGDDVADGGAGHDTIFGDAGNDFIRAGAGNDEVDGGEGNDVIAGGDGDNSIRDGEGRDHVRGEAGDDTIVAALDGEWDIYEGGEGRDLLDYSAAREDLAIDLVSGTASGLEIGEDVILGFEAVQGGCGNDHFVAGNIPVALAGGGGENIFEFIGAPPAAPEPEPLTFEILDFKVGDRIRMSKYDLFEKAFDEFEDEFERIYGDDIDDDDVRIRFRYESDDMRERTIVEADFDRDSSFETTITLEGQHLLVIVAHA